MTVHAPVTMTKEAFLAWVERREERYEFSGGRVTMMVRITRNHSRVTTNLIFALKSRLQGEQYDVLAKAFAVHAGDSVRFPDVLVELSQPDGKSLRAESPILIAEVCGSGPAARFRKSREIIEKRDQRVPLPALAIDIPLEDIYRGIT